MPFVLNAALWEMSQIPNVKGTAFDLERETVPPSLSRQV